LEPTWNWFTESRDERFPESFHDGGPITITLLAAVLLLGCIAAELGAGSIGAQVVPLATTIAIVAVALVTGL
jgi:hypothetical protein